METFEYEDDQPIPEGLLPLGADWSDANDEEVQRALSDFAEYMRLGWILALGSAGIEVADIALEGSLKERLADQNARMRELDLEED
jgi:hypothetical protein